MIINRRSLLNKINMWQLDHQFSTTKRKPYHRKESAGSTIPTKDRSQNSQPINRLRLIQHCIRAIQMVAGSPSVVVCQSLSNPVALGRICTVSPHALHWRRQSPPAFECLTDSTAADRALPAFERQTAMALCFFFPEHESVCCDSDHSDAGSSVKTVLEPHQTDS